MAVMKYQHSYKPFPPHNFPQLFSSTKPTHTRSPVPAKPVLSSVAAGPTAIVDAARLGQLEAALQQQSSEMAANLRQVEKLSSRVRLLSRDQQMPLKQVSSGVPA